ncbi:MAG: hypothetical protein K2G02_01485 [Phocaeicola sp.]|uniref:hypothetical protein n=1 Tax=Phocaeicola sp. TaxID=2773926 RepID=UPI0023D5574F|nr:hypothetical protein [Phocaeicola sp.]MDE5677188.1 hypothetical protein [Phocaeicola sp.]MDE6179804.1 hypothetical protein [Phocaeicola sp.]
MKKVLFLFVLLLFSVGMMAQRVMYDETNRSGVRTIVCEGMNLGVSGDMDVYVALAGFQYKSTVRYSLAVTIGSGHEVQIPDGSQCILTLDNGKAIELSTVAGGASVLQHVDVEMEDVFQSFRRFAYYNIKAKELKKLGKNGLVRLDMQLSPQNYSVTFAQDALGSVLMESMSLINNLFGK